VQCVLTRSNLYSELLVGKLSHVFDYPPNPIRATSSPPHQIKVHSSSSAPSFFSPSSSPPAISTSSLTAGLSCNPASIASTSSLYFFAFAFLFSAKALIRALFFSFFAALFAVFFSALTLAFLARVLSFQRNMCSFAPGTNALASGLKVKGFGARAWLRLL
jgi:hypothetical protein